jgi:DNA-binding protein H-NS
MRRGTLEVRLRNRFEEILICRASLCEPHFSCDNSPINSYSHLPAGDELTTENFEALLQQADELIKRAHEIREKEKPEAITRIKAEISKYELTAEDLGLSASSGSKREKAGTSGKTYTANTGKPKYRNPETGQTWSGRGQPPGWIKDAPDREIYRSKG